MSTAKKFTATPALVEGTIKAEAYHVFPGTTMTVCCLTMLNDFSVLGHSACANPENFDAELGKKLARQQAISRAQEMVGYSICEVLAERKQQKKHDEYCERLLEALDAAFGIGA